MSSLTRSKHKHQKQQRRKLSKAEKLQRQWDKVQRLQQQNEKLKEDIAELVANVTHAIEPQEQALTAALYEQSLQLIKFVAKKTLSQYQRQELVCWIEDNIEEIHHNPFAQHLDMQALHDSFQQALDEHFAIQKKHLSDTCENIDFEEEISAQDESQAKRRDRTGPMDDMFEDLFGEASDDDDEEADDDAFFEEFGYGFDDEKDAYDEQLHQQGQALDNLLKSTSINKLFRKVARAIHPDLAQDDAERKQKHDFMIHLTSARDNKDIITIFSMYTEHVGELPTDLFTNDLDKMIILLDFQEQQLAQQKDDIIYSNPYQSAIYTKFSAKSNAQLKKNIREHKQLLTEAMESQKSLTAKLTSLAKLKPILLDRVESRRDAMFESLMDLEEFFGGVTFR